MANGFPFFKVFPGDELGDDRLEAMNAAEYGAYCSLRKRAWLGNPVGTIPDDDALLARWARMTRDEWAAAKAIVLRLFSEPTNGRRTLQALVEQFADAEARSATARAKAEQRWGRGNAGGDAGAHAGASATAHAGADTPAFPGLMPEQSRGNAHSQQTTGQKSGASAESTASQRAGAGGGSRAGTANQGAVVPRGVADILGAAGITATTAKRQMLILAGVGEPELSRLASNDSLTKEFVGDLCGQALRLHERKKVKRPGAWVVGAIDKSRRK